MGISIKSLISVQASYKIYYTPLGVLTCDSVICIPLADIVTRQNRFDNQSHDMIPAVEIIPPANDLKLKIITNEGVTVEPFTTEGLNASANPYAVSRIYFTLPRGTTGIKTVIDDRANVSYKMDLVFDIMSPPYDYDNALFGVSAHITGYNFNQISTLRDNVSKLDGRVDALETKTNNLRIVSHELNASFPYKDLPKGSGKQTLNIDKDMLFIGTNFTYGSSPSIVHSPKITVSDGITTKVYTLSLNTSVRVIIDLLTATLTAYKVDTGEIVQQRKIFETVVGYKSIDYEDFDDILNDELTVLIGGRSVE